ncbi:hypothetical protein ACFYNO_12735 [Kitasatospora sp. NPDC006697]|uniref:hypothetical protein n=1 Tax=Kitasatospora sp. NPDC006697 TaxID=3364020 RepID=UPI0036AE8F1F
MSRTTIRTVGAAALLAAGLLLTGCSSSSGSATAASTGGAAASPSASDGKGAGMAAYTDCLRQHGVAIPTGRPSGRPTDRPTDRPSGSPGGGGGGFFGGGSADPARQAAMQACASLRPQGGSGRGGNGGFNSTAMQAFTSCLKDHGVTLPASGGLRALNTADPNTAAAYKTCEPLLPARGSGTPSAPASDQASPSPAAS